MVNKYEKGAAHSEIEHYDTVILGGGPAGLTAAIYAGRYNMKTLVIARSFGGTAASAGEIENWPGIIGSGMEIMNKIKEQTGKFGAQFLEEDVTTVKKDDNGFVIELAGHEIHTKTLIVALGTEHRQLNIPGEKEFLGKGVSYCATCDGNFFRGKTVSVIGGADSAAKAALYLSDICEKVYVVYRKHEMRCEPISLKNICEKENIEIHYFSKPLEIIGEGAVKGLKILKESPARDDSGEPEKDGKPEEITLDVDGVFIEIGATPAVDVIKELGIEMDKNYIKTDKGTRTNVEGVFAAGDVTNNEMKQMVVAAGEGAIAAKNAHEFLMK